MEINTDVILSKTNTAERISEYTNQIVTAIDNELIHKVEIEEYYNNGVLDTDDDLWIETNVEDTIGYLGNRYIIDGVVVDARATEIVEELIPIYKKEDRRYITSTTSNRAIRINNLNMVKDKHYYIDVKVGDRTGNYFDFRWDGKWISTDAEQVDSDGKLQKVYKATANHSYVDICISSSNQYVEDVEVSIKELHMIKLPKGEIAKTEGMGNELTVNGLFRNNLNGWSISGDVTYNSQNCKLDGTNGQCSIEQSVSGMVVGKQYRYGFEITEGNVSVRVRKVSGGYSIIRTYGIGIHHIDFIFDNTMRNRILFVKDSGIGVIDSISMREITYDKVIHTYPKGAYSVLDTSINYIIGADNPAPSRCTITGDMTNGYVMDSVGSDGVPPAIVFQCHPIDASVFRITTDKASSSSVFVNNKRVALVVGENTIHIPIRNNIGITSIQVYGALNDVTTFTNISLTNVNDTYKCIKDAPIGTSITNKEYFRTIESINRHDIVTLIKDSNNNYSYESRKLSNIYGRDDINLVDDLLYKENYINIATGLWSKNNNIVLPLRYFQRLNKGAYHPWLNSLGVGKAVNNAITGWEEWYDVAVRKGLVSSDYFTNYTIGSGVANPSGSVGSSGLIAYGASTYFVGRPDKKYNDLIYNNLSFDISTKASSTNNELLLETIVNNDLTGITKGIGASSKVVRFTSAETGTLDSSQSYNHDGDKLPPKPGSIIYSTSEDNSYIDSAIIKGTTINNSSINTVTINDMQGTNTRGNYYIIQESKELYNGAVNSRDILGNPNHYPSTLKERLANGQYTPITPLLKDIKNDLLPGGSSKSYLIINSNKIIKSTNSMWIDDTIHWVLDMKTPNLVTNNLLGIACWQPVDRAWLMEYTSHAPLYHPYTPGTPLTKEPVVYASNNHDVTKGALASNSISNLVSTNTDSLEAHQITKEVNNILTYPSPSQSPDTTFRYHLERDSKTNKKKIVVIAANHILNTTVKLQRILNEY